MYLHMYGNDACRIERIQGVEKKSGRNFFLPLSFVEMQKRRIERLASFFKETLNPMNILLFCLSRSKSICLP